MKLFIAILFALILALTAMAQVKYKEGKPAELKGLTKIFVETEGDVESYRYIVATLEEAKLPKVKIVDEIEKSEIVLEFKYDITNITVTASGVATAENPGRSVGYAMIAGSNPKKLRRIAFHIGMTQNPKARDKTSIEFVNAFVKTYKKVNKLK